MKTQPFVSVIICVCGDRLPACLDSALNQDGAPAYEVICAHYAPETRLCNTATSADSVLSSVRTVRSACGADAADALNRAVDASDGEYVMFAEEDDRLPPDAIASVARALCDAAADTAVWHNVRTERNAAERDREMCKDVFRRKYRGTRTGEELFRAMYSDGNYDGTANTCAVRKKLLTENGIRFESGAYSEGRLFVLQALLASKRAEYLGRLVVETDTYRNPHLIRRDEYSTADAEKAALRMRETARNGNFGAHTAICINDFADKLTTATPKDGAQRH